MLLSVELRADPEFDEPVSHDADGGEYAGLDRRRFHGCCRLLIRASARSFDRGGVPLEVLIVRLFVVF